MGRWGWCLEGENFRVISSWLHGIQCKAWPSLQVIHLLHPNRVGQGEVDLASLSLLSQGLVKLHTLHYQSLVVSASHCDN